jgi:hypothetical protein
MTEKDNRAELHIFTMQGVQVHQQSLSSSSGEVQVGLESLPTGQLHDHHYQP